VQGFDRCTFLASADEYLDERLQAQTTELKAYADEKQAELAGMIERTTNVASRVERLEARYPGSRKSSTSHK
jgi:hypothetical protein